MISVTQSNVEIHPSLAGIGDVVMESDSGNVQTTPSGIRIIKGSTYNGGISGYHVYGVIYGFEKGCAMVMAKDEAAKKWADNASQDIAAGAYAGEIVSATTISTSGKPRNANLSAAGNQAYLTMNAATIKANSNNSALTSTLLHPTHVIHPSWVSWAGVTTAQMSVANFDADTNGAKTMYKTYENYVRQCMPIGNGGGGVFDLKYHVGKENTRILAQYYDTSHLDAQSRWYPAATYCYTYGRGSGEWWLPDMVELRQMFKDETNDLLQVTIGKIGGTSIAPSAASRWSSVRYSATYAWNFSNFGFSYNNSFGYGMQARPVTLLKLK